MKDYNVEIVNCSRETELTNRETIKYKNPANFNRIDKATADGKIVRIEPDFWVELDIHNEKAKDGKDYKNYIIVTKSGECYVTGSKNFFDRFSDIHADMCGEEYELDMFQAKCKNREGNYLTCAIV